MSNKVKTVYTCQKCGAQFPKWSGVCNDCGAWNTLIEETFTPIKTANPRFQNYAGDTSQVTPLAAVDRINQPRISTTLAELDRVLGGGLVAGATVLIGGDPGIGKSTLLLQALCALSNTHKILYVTGEESLQQIALRAERLELLNSNLLLAAETQVEKIIALATKEHPEIIAVDSIQTMYTEQLTAAPGGASQIRESTAQLLRFAKQTHTAMFIVGHVTKEGTIAGPKVLEHMVDSVLYFEGDRDSHFRIVRTTKNRFGAVNEIGIFAMTEHGLKAVNNPSAIFLANPNTNIAGSSILVTWEGSRPLLVEVQALLDESHSANPRRVTAGMDANRLAILLAVLHRHGGIPTYDQDVFINIVGGLKISETASDLALLLAIISSIRNHPLPSSLVTFGEVGLAGEVRPVQCGQERIKAAMKHGFKTVLLPSANLPKQPLTGVNLIGVKNLTETLQALRNL